MKKSLRMLLVSLCVGFLLTACIVPTRHGGVGIILPPPLPVIVDLGPDPYFYQDGYYYYHHDNRWQYSRERNGGWEDLPNSHWPREIRRRDDRR